MAERAGGSVAPRSGAPVNPASLAADDALLRAHNARVETQAAQHELTRARRSLALLRASLTEERRRATEAEDILRNLAALACFAGERGMGIGSELVEMHIRVALRAMGREAA